MKLPQFSFRLFIVTILFFTTMFSVVAEETEFRKLPVSVYRDKMKAGWIGQIAGVSWAAPTEFKYLERIIPEDEMPKWKPEMINDAFGQDDLYVEMTFLRTLEEHGLDVCIRQAGIDFANSGYQLWHANVEGRRNLRAGIAPPDSSHPQFNKCADDIDYLIEADFSGLIAPGLPTIAIELGEKFGRLMNYGDGVYAGMFIGACYSEAFFETDMLKIIAAGLKAIPADSQFAEMVRDLLAWYKEEPNNWIKTWEKIEAKYQKNPDYRRFSCNPGAFNIDAKINGAYVLMGMLYGKGDLDETIIISTRCGQDSDCNPSNAAGVLFTTLGFSKLPPKFSEKLDETRVFSHTAYNFPALLDACEKIARQAVVKAGGFIEKNAEGEDVFVIPVKEIKLEGPTMRSWEPGPIADSLFTDEEQAKIRFKGFRTIEDAVAGIFPGWTVKNCGPDMHPGMRDKYRGKKDVVMTHPLNRETPCTLELQADIPTDKKTVLKAVVSNHPNHDWVLVFRVNDSVQKTVTVNEELTKGGWVEVVFDLTPFAGGKNVQIKLENKANGWSFEAGYWASLTIESE